MTWCTNETVLLKATAHLIPARDRMRAEALLQVYLPIWGGRQRLGGWLDHQGQKGRRLPETSFLLPILIGLDPTAQNTSNPITSVFIKYCRLLKGWGSFARVLGRRGGLLGRGCCVKRGVASISRGWATRPRSSQPCFLRLTFRSEGVSGSIQLRSRLSAVLCLLVSGRKKPKTDRVSRSLHETVKHVVPLWFWQCTL